MLLSVTLVGAARADSVLVMFTSDNCPACEAAMPDVEKVQVAHAVTVLKGTQYEAKYKITAYPTFVAFANNQEVDRAVGNVGIDRLLEMCDIAERVSHAAPPKLGGLLRPNMTRTVTTVTPPSAPSPQTMLVEPGPKLAAMLKRLEMLQVPPPSIAAKDQVIALPPGWDKALGDRLTSALDASAAKELTARKQAAEAMQATVATLGKKQEETTKQLMQARGPQTVTVELGPISMAELKAIRALLEKPPVPPAPPEPPKPEPSKILTTTNLQYGGGIVGIIVVLLLWLFAYRKWGNSVIYAGVAVIALVCVVGGGAVKYYGDGGGISVNTKPVKVFVVRESEDDITLTVAQLAWIKSPKFAADCKAAGIEFHAIDQHLKGLDSKTPKELVPIIDRAKAKGIPRIVLVGSGGGLSDYPVPATEADAKTILGIGQ
jgi:thiol-disulfide isomerase/thioredoxin